MNPKYKIVYIDEQQEDADSFMNYVEQKDATGEFEVEHLVPAATIEEMISELVGSSPNAIVSDFQLNDFKELINYNVPYTGTLLVEHFQEIRNLFPCFVLTSFDTEAATNIDDVNLIYAKSIFNGHEDRGGLNFLDRVKAQIDHYQLKIANAENELTQLVKKKSAGGLDAPGEQKLIELDSFLEASVDGHNPVPENLKSFSNLQKLEDLIAKVDILVAEVKSGK